MFKFPKTLHPLYLFEEETAFYAADLDKATVVELSAVVVNILKLAETHTNSEIVKALKTSHVENDIFQAFERFAELLLFNRGENLKETAVIASERRKLLVAIPGIATDSFFNIETLSAGTNMAFSYMFKHLAKYVDLHFTSNRNRKVADNLYEVDINVADFGRLSRNINETYFGILTLHLDPETWLLPLYQHIELPPILV